MDIDAQIAAEERELERRRAECEFVAIIEERQPRPGTAEVNCARCDRLSSFDAYRQCGWCRWRKRLIGTWHPVLCKGFAPLTRERGIKVVWQGVVNG